MLRKKICRTRCGEEMYEWGQNIKKRRARQIRSIQHGQLINPDYPFPKEWDMGESVSFWKQSQSSMDRSKKWIRKLTIQSVLSLMLLVVTYVIFQNDSTSGYRAQEFVTEVMSRPFNFEGMSVWYRQNIGTSPTILPAFHSKSKDQSMWISPVAGKIVLPFNQKRNGVVIRTQKDEKVVAPANGWVIFAGEKEGIGRTVILQHEDGKHTWLSLLGAYEVKTKQWVNKGEKIGTAGLKSGQSLVYVAIQQQGKFINPTEVIPFD